jgi:hypothetical protein
LPVFIADLFNQDGFGGRTAAIGGDNDVQWTATTS